MGSTKASDVKPSQPYFPHFPRFRVHIFRISAFSAFLLRGASSDPCFCRRGFRIFRIFLYRVRIADFKNLTDRLCYDRPLFGDT